ncbi:MAG TPA: FtsX-like permease family protein, partial [Vicinamibacterales bacterium]|nr:FtsX-like permease family protein [Vicinamibacterales bacterium]
AHIQHVTDGYFEALRIPVVAGRTFTRSDHVRAPQVAIVNETFVKRFAGGRAAIGLRLQLGILGPGGAGEPWEVVGVIRDVKTGSLGDADLATPEIYVPCAQSAMPSMFVAVRTAPGSEPRIVPELRAAVRAIDAELPIGTVTPMDQRVGGSVRRERFRTTMICAFAVLALLLSSIGVYAIRSQAVAARIREMGIRLALGASRRQLLRMVLSQGLRQVMTGLTAGLVAAVWFVRFVEPWLFATRATDVSIMAGAALLFGAAALVASWVPARRASAVDPVTLLRHD